MDCDPVDIAELYDVMSLSIKPMDLHSKSLFGVQIFGTTEPCQLSDTHVHYSMTSLNSNGLLFGC